VSDKFYSLLSKTGKSYCRLCDNVTVKGSKNPMGLYTVDLDLSELKVEKEVKMRKSRK
jgi:hypothetical protein